MNNSFTVKCNNCGNELQAWNDKGKAHFDLEERENSGIYVGSKDYSHFTLISCNCGNEVVDG